MLLSMYLSMHPLQICKDVSFALAQALFKSYPSLNCQVVAVQKPMRFDPLEVPQHRTIGAEQIACFSLGVCVALCRVSVCWCVCLSSLYVFCSVWMFVCWVYSVVCSALAFVLDVLNTH